MNEPLRTEAHRASVAEVRRLLRDLWAREGLTNDGVMRARTFNLVVYAEGDDAATSAAIEQLTELTAHRPGRIILIQYDEFRAEPLEAWVTLYCRADGPRQVCAEVVGLVVGPDTRREIHSTVISLLSADLPVYLWWRVLPAEDDHLFEHLTDEAERVIVDAGSVADPAEALPRLAALTGLALGDVSWARLTPWRRMIAHLWDTPYLREPLRRVLRVRIEHTGPATRALLLAGWLADRLGWELRAPTGGSGELRVLFDAAAGPGEIELAAVTADLPAGAIVAVTIEAGEESVVRPRLAVSAARGCVEVTTGAAGGQTAVHGAPFAPVRTLDALAEVLDFRYDPTYEGALKLAARIAQQARA